ncbi:HlyD family efflux transporter periplasmic adaptor subunit [Prochlorococcus marinus]|uniref:HlyD family efflux transporter periplasmic adaptor subunit n=1 Tax=Prochlorococcus marinus TaxID=1219 RepID=UPI000533B5C0|nr:HlyD family efflux transporter periplasmic adaptor subunit [Prochlorococcus marinus]KGG12329.1 putative ABC transporter component [Prochlorococcus sp. MIT 0601]
MKTIWFPTIGILLIVAVLILNRKNETLPEEAPVSLSAVRVVEAVAALGQLTPKGESRVLAAPVSSFGGTPRIAELYVEEGDPIKEGQILAIFDNRYRLLADLEISRVQLQTINSNILFQEREVARYKKTSQEGASSESLSESKEDTLQILLGKKQQIVAEIKGIEVDLSHTQLKSPINGIVLRINSRVGERPGSEGVLQVGSIDVMEALIEVYESDINRVIVNQQVTLISENGGFDGTLYGYVSKISPQIRQRKVLSTDPTGDADARIVEVRVILEESSSARVSRFSGMKVIARFSSQ